MYFYVYKLSWGKSYYIGRRKSKVPPDKDTYKGSGYYCLFGVKYHPMVKTILSVHSTFEESAREEARLLSIHVGKNGCVNRKKSGCWKYGYV